jgi:hypothetical protein
VSPVREHFEELDPSADKPIDILGEFRLYVPSLVEVAHDFAASEVRALHWR